VASPLGILPLPPSRFCPLPPYCPLSWHLTAKTPPPAGTLRLPSGWQPTATHGLAPYCYTLAGTLLLLLRSVDPSSVTPSCGIALPPWRLSNALDGCNDLHDCASSYCGPMVSMFSPVADHQSSNQAPQGPHSTRCFFCLGEPAEVFESFYLYLSMSYFLKCLGYILLGARRGKLFLWTWGV